MKRPALFLLALFFCAHALFAQQKKGLSIDHSTDNPPTGETYALIIGISNYKNSAIPSLKYADKDAMAFRNYLVATGSDTGNIELLLNEDATNSNIWLAVADLTEKARKGDKVYIYFSGHGDVESKLITQDAYLLPYDAPRVVYVSGAISVTLLKNYLATLSSKGTEVVLITDACHSGDLAGGREGMETMSLLLEGQWKDEIKILSCQHGELSLEGQQWGGGRGLFSYELINGLSGMADKDRDGIVTLKELNVFLLEKVSDAASPIAQNPLLSGDMTTGMAKVISKLSRTIVAQNDDIKLAKIDVRGFDDALLRKLPDSVKYEYNEFKKQLDSGHLWSYQYDEPADKEAKKPSAYDHLIKIPDNKDTRQLLSIARRNLAAAMISGLESVIQEYTLLNIYAGLNMPVIIVTCPSYHTPLYNILGQDKLTKMGLLPKIYFMQAITSTEKNKMGSVLTKTGRSFLDSAMYYGPGCSYVYEFQMAQEKQSKNYKKAIMYGKKAIELSPKLYFVYDDVADIYSISGDSDSSLMYYKQLYTAIKSTPKAAMEGYLTENYGFMGPKFIKNAVDEYYKYALFKIGIQYTLLNNKDSASNYFAAYFDNNKYYDDSASIYEIKIDIGDHYNNSGDYVKAVANYKYAVAIKNNLYTNYKIAAAYSLLNNKEEALKYIHIFVEKSVQAKQIPFMANRLISDEFDNIRDMPDFKGFLKKYDENNISE